MGNSSVSKDTSTFRVPGSHDVQWPTVLSAGGNAGHILCWQRYNEKTQSWQDVEQTSKEEEEEEKEEVDITKVTVMTFNVWFGRHRRRTRTRALARLIQHEDATVVCLQEVTSLSWSVLLADEYVQKNFCVSSSQGVWEALAESSGGYDCAMLMRREMLGKKNTDLMRFEISSQYGRRFLFCCSSLCGFGFGCVHMDSDGRSGSAREIRSQQTDQMFTLASEFGHWDVFVLCGDFNHCPVSFDGEDHVTQHNAIDVWKQMHHHHHDDDNGGWTFDDRANGMLNAKGEQVHRADVKSRLDRIVVKQQQESKPTQWKPQSIRVIGDKALVNDKDDDDDETDARFADAPLFISDHFGVVATFVKEK